MQQLLVWHALQGLYMTADNSNAQHLKPFCMLT